MKHLTTLLLLIAVATLSSCTDTDEVEIPCLCDEITEKKVEIENAPGGGFQTVYYLNVDDCDSNATAWNAVDETRYNETTEGDCF